MSTSVRLTLRSSRRFSSYTTPLLFSSSSNANDSMLSSRFTYTVHLYACDTDMCFLYISTIPWSLAAPPFAQSPPQWTFPCWQQGGQKWGQK